MNKMKRVIVYTRCESCHTGTELPDCMGCANVINFLKSKEIHYHEEDVSKYREVFESSHKISNGELFPLIQVNDDFVQGFDKNKLEELLNQ